MVGQLLVSELILVLGCVKNTKKERSIGECLNRVINHRLKNVKA